MRASIKISVFFAVLFCTVVAGYAQISDKIRSEITSKSFQLGSKYLLLGDKTKAAKYFDSAIATSDSTHSPALYFKAVTIADTNADLALYLVNKATIIWEDNTEFLDFKARLLTNAKKYDEARKTYLKLYELNPLNPIIIYYCSLFAIIDGDFAGAIKYSNEYETKFGFNEKIYEVKCDYFSKQNKLDSLYDYVENTVEDQPTNTKVLMQYALLLSYKNNDSLAEQTYRRAVELEPNNGKLYVAFTDFYISTKNFEPIIDVAQGLFKIVDVSAEYKIHFTQQLFKYINPGGELKDGIAELIAVITNVHPNHNGAAIFYSDYLNFIGRQEYAYKFLKAKYIDGSLSEGLVRTFLSHLYFSADRAKIFDVTNEFVTKYPANFDINSFLLALLVEKKEYEQAVKVADDIIKSTPSDSLKSITYVSKAQAIEYVASTKKTIAAHENAIKCDTASAIALNNYAYFLARKSTNLDKALAMINKAIELQPNDVNNLDTKAWVLFKMKRYQEANTVMIKVLSLNNKLSDEVTLHLGDILFANGMELLARDKWKNLSERYQDNSISDRLQLTKGDVEELLRIIKTYE